MGFLVGWFWVSYVEGILPLFDFGCVLVHGYFSKKKLRGKLKQFKRDCLMIAVEYLSLPSLCTWEDEKGV